MVKLIEKLFTDSARLDNPLLNLGQPDVIPYDPVLRAQALTYKVPPKVTRGYIPRTVTGEIDMTQVPDHPAIVVQVISGKAAIDVTEVTARIMVTAYDENPNNQGYQDVQNMIETLVIVLTSWGQKALDDAYPIVMPIEWKLQETEIFPHFAGEITTRWQLPSARPLPDSEIGLGVPAEHIDLRVSEDTRIAELVGAT